MKKMLYAAFAALFAFRASAQEQDFNLRQVYLDINCFGDIRPYVQMIETDYNEQALFVGRSVLPIANFLSGEPDLLEGIMATYVNQDTGTFTNVITFPDGSGCEFSYGNDFTPVTN
jgi:hypothetical protein